MDRGIFYIMNSVNLGVVLIIGVLNFGGNINLWDNLYLNIVAQMKKSGAAF